MSSAAKRPRPEAPRKVKTAKMNEGKVDISVTFKAVTFMCADGMVKPLSDEPRIYDRNATDEGQLLRDVEKAFLDANPEFFAKYPHARAGVFLKVGDDATRALRLRVHQASSLFQPAAKSVFHNFPPPTPTAEALICVVDAKALLDAWCVSNNITSIPPFTDWSTVNGLPDIMNYVHCVASSLLRLQEPYTGGSGVITSQQGVAIHKLFCERPEVFAIEDKTLLSAFDMLCKLGHVESLRFPVVNVLVRRTDSATRTRHQMTTLELRRFKNPATTPAKREAILGRTQKPLMFIELAMPF